MTFSEGSKDIVINDSVKQYMDALASDKPAPGGGSASALIGAVGVALLSMVANLTIGKRKFKASEPLIKELLEKAENLRRDLENLVTEDTKAFNEVAKVFKMPRSTTKEKIQRKEKMQEALKFATKVPFAIMEKVVDAIYLHEKSLGNINPTVISDTGVGALCLKAALQGAWLNVKINLISIKDKEFVQNQGEKAQKLLNEGTLIADKVYKTVERNIA